MKKTRRGRKSKQFWQRKGFLSMKGTYEQLAMLKKVMAENLRLYLQYMLPLVVVLALGFFYGRFYFNWLAAWLATPLTASGSALSLPAVLSLAGAVAAFLIGAVVIARAIGGLGQAMVEKKGLKDTFMSMANLSAKRSFNLLTYCLLLFFVWLLPSLIMAVLSMIANNNLTEAFRLLVFGQVNIPAEAWPWFNWPAINFVLVSVTLVLLSDLFYRAFLAPLFIAKEGLSVNSSLQKARVYSIGARTVFLLLFCLIWTVFNLVFLQLWSVEIVDFLSWGGALWLGVVCAVLSSLIFVTLGSAVVHANIKKQTVAKIADSFAFRLALWVIILPIIVFWTAFSFLHRSVSDASGINDLDLAIDRTNAEPAENAYLLIHKDYVRLGAATYNQVKASEAFAGQTKYNLEQWASGKSWNQAKVDLVLARGVSELDMYDKARVLPFYQAPVGQFFMPGFGPVGGPVMVMARLAAIRGRNMLVHGNWQGAQVEAMHLLSFSRLLANSKTSYFENYYLAKTIASSYAWPLLNSVVDGGKLDANGLAVLATVLPADDSSFETAIKGSYQLAKVDINYGANSYFRNERYFLLPDECAGLTAQLAHYVAKLSELRSNHMKSFISSANDNYVGPQFLADFFKKNTQCDLYLSAYLRSAKQAYDAKLQENWDKNAFTVKLAMHRYYLANKKWPTSIELLVPGFLKALPDDPFTLKPMIMQSDQGYLYSVGPNGEDEKGGHDDLRLNYR